MSHDATNWAIKQRGIKPAAKLVLWQLCDRYHPDNGCFPSKETLAEDCEMSVRSVYDQVAILEAAGLVRVVENTHKAASGKFKSNRYILGFEPDFTPLADKPSAKSADGKTSRKPSANSRKNRGQNLPTNSVREPVSEPCEADAPHTDLFDEFWEAYPKPNNEAVSKQLFDEAVEAGADPAHIVAAAVAYEAENKGNSSRYLKFSDNWLREEKWKNHKASAAKKVFTNDQRLNFYAKIINSAKPVSPSAINVGLANELLAAGLVTPEKLKERGIAA